MYNPSEISTIIKLTAQNRKITVKKMLEDCKINKGFIYDLEHKSSYPSCDKIYRIADYFDCSVDFLLGRTDTPQVSQNNVIHTGDITGNHNANINSKDNSDTQELLELIKSLPLVKRAEAIILINDLKKKENG